MVKTTQAHGYTTVAGATSYTITNLTPGNPYYFVVRAQDQAGNIDTNKVEKSATVTAPSLANNVQPIFTANCLTNACHAGANPAQGLALTSASVSWLPTWSTLRAVSVRR